MNAAEFLLELANLIRKKERKKHVLMAFPNVHIVAKSLRMCFVGASWQWYTMRMNRTDVFTTEFSKPMSVAVIYSSAHWN